MAYIKKISDQIQKGNTRIYRGRKRLCSIIGRSMDIHSEDIGFIRCTEFGGKEGRFHIHVVIMKSFFPVMQSLQDDGNTILWDKKEDIHYILQSTFWKFGMVRILGLSKPTNAVQYLSKHSTEKSPGRVTVDKRSRAAMREREKIFGIKYKQKHGIKGGEFTYQPTGSEKRFIESNKDKTYLRRLTR